MYYCKTIIFKQLLKALYKTRLGTMYRSSIFFPYKDCIQVIMNSVIIKFCHSLLFQKKGI